MHRVAGERATYTDRTHRTAEFLHALSPAGSLESQVAHRTSDSSREANLPTSEKEAESANSRNFKFTTASALLACPFALPGWRNWQTQRTQNPSPQGVWVRPPLRAPALLTSAGARLDSSDKDQSTCGVRSCLCKRLPIRKQPEAELKQQDS
jgi:hypothetical protein